MNPISKLTENVVDGVNDVLTNPKYHEYLAILKGTRNGELGKRVTKTVLEWVVWWGYGGGVVGGCFVAGMVVSRGTACGILRLDLRARR